MLFEGAMSEHLCCPSSDLLVSATLTCSQICRVIVRANVLLPLNLKDLNPEEGVEFVSVTQ